MISIKHITQITMHINDQLINLTHVYAMKKDTVVNKMVIYALF